MYSIIFLKLMEKYGLDLFWMTLALLRFRSGGHYEKLFKDLEGTIYWF